MYLRGIVCEFEQVLSANSNKSCLANTVAAKQAPTDRVLQISAALPLAQRLHRPAWPQAKLQSRRPVSRENDINIPQS
jgi:hypothetical protein